MPKRWERELERLDHVEAPTARIRERAAEGPTSAGREPERSGKQSLVAGVVAFAVFAVAGVFAWQIFRPASVEQLGPGPVNPQGVVVNFVATDRQNSARGTLTSGDQTSHGSIGSHCWTFPGGSGCADMVAPSFAPSEFVAVERGSTLTVSGDASPVVGEIDRDGPFPYDRVDDFGTITDPIVLDQPAGRYVLSLNAHFDQGDVPFYFPIELVEPVSGTDEPTTGAADQRIGVYEAMIRRLADPRGSKPIYVSTELCSMLADPPGAPCADRISRADQQALIDRLAGLGNVSFRGRGEQAVNGRYPVILLGPIIEKVDRLRVEGGSLCGSLCGGGAMYVVVPTDSGYEVTGTDDSYGSWIS